MVEDVVGDGARRDADVGVGEVVGDDASPAVGAELDGLGVSFMRADPCGASVIWWTSMSGE